MCTSRVLSIAISATRRWSLAVALMLIATSVQAGTVETVAGRFDGPISFHADGVKVGEKQVAIGEVLYLYADPAQKVATGKAQPIKSLVRLRTGEVWIGPIAGASSKEVKVTNGWFGKKAFSLKQVSVLDFMPHEPITVAEKRKTLYRKPGKPLPGAIVWIDKKSLGLDSPLGTVTLRRQGLVRYVMDNKPAPVVTNEKAQDEVGLADGNVFRGQIEMKDGEIIFTHPVGGRATFPAKIVSYIIRHTPAMVELSALPHEKIKAEHVGLAKGTQLAMLGRSTAKCVRSVRLEPKIAIRYALPARDGKKLVLRATLAPVAPARGDAQIKFSVGGRTVLQKVISASDSRVPVEIVLPEGKELTIDVDFGPLLRFPCGAVLQDAHLVLVK
jgi:hypothetical protein